MRRLRPQTPAGSSLWLLVVLALLLASLTTTTLAKADPPTDTATRVAIFEWDPSDHFVAVTLSFRDIIDLDISRKLSRGLPTTIVFTAAIFRSGQAEPVATTAQTCKITWHVWEEAYRVEISRPGLQQSRWTATLEGVLRRCAEVSALPAGDRTQIPAGSSVSLKARVQVNPVSPSVLSKIKGWISRPSATSTARPGDALFSTFTGLFLQRIGEAERELNFTTLPVVPRPAPRPPETADSGKSS